MTTSALEGRSGVERWWRRKGEGFLCQYEDVGCGEGRWAPAWLRLGFLMGISMVVCGC